MSRHARENIRPAQYLGSSYYEIWLEGLIRLLTSRGLTSLEEIKSGSMKDPPKQVAGKLIARDVTAVLARGGPASRPSQPTARFSIGDGVRARNIHPQSHTRLPRYLRGHPGEIIAAHGTHVFPDSSAHGRGDDPQWLYTVRFSSREIWGDAARDGDTICADLWEPYLEKY